MAYMTNTCPALLNNGLSQAEIDALFIDNQSGFSAADNYKAR